jgi:hypothetical protein
LLPEEAVCYRDLVRGIAVTVCAALAGCLYVGDRNHPPQGSIQVVQPNAGRCSDVVLRAEASDPDGDDLSYGWSVVVQSTEPGQADRYELPSAAGSPICPEGTTAPVSTTAERSSKVIGSLAELKLIRVPWRGTYRVDLRLRDSSGAETWAAPVAFTVSDATPTIDALQVDLDPQVTSYTLPDLNDQYAAHGHYLAWIKEAEDADDDLKCGNSGSSRVTRAWEPLGRQPEDFEYWEPVCDALSKQPYGGVRFRLKPERATAGDLGVRVTLTDSLGAKVSHDAHLPVVANRPPCIRTVTPYLDDTVKLSVAEPNGFFVLSLSDDVPQLMEFTWSSKDAAAAGFTPLAVQTSMVPPSLTLPAWFRSPGDKLQLRLSVREVGGPEPDCADVNQLSCPWSGATGCNRWVTWSVEFE